MKVVANIPILYHGVQYKSGDVIKDFDLETLELWLKCKSVRKEGFENESVQDTSEEEEPPVQDTSKDDEPPMQDTSSNVKASTRKKAGDA